MTASDDILPRSDRLRRFEQIALPHLDAAYNLARWLAGNDHDARDVVQEAYLRALRFFGGFHGTDGRAWLMAIVRNTYYTWRQQNRPAGEIHGSDRRQAWKGACDEEVLDEYASVDSSPEALLLAESDRRMVNQAIEALPLEFRETLVLRELHDCSYKEIASIVGIPVGTVMSRLSRARRLVAQALTGRSANEL